MKIIAGTTHYKLARNIANVLEIEFITPEVRKFNDGELAITISGDLTGIEVAIVQSTCSPVSENLFELLLLIDAVKRAKAKNITVIIPYFGYSRSDTSLRLIADQIECAGATKIVTVDLHSIGALKFFKIPIINLSAGDLFLPLIDTSSAPVIVSPDLGGISRAKYLSNSLSLSFASIYKKREASDLYRMTALEGVVQDKHCVIVDDIIDSGGTSQKAVEFLIQHGARSVEAFISHGVLSNHAENKLENLPIENIYITNAVCKFWDKSSIC